MFVYNQKKKTLTLLRLRINVLHKYFGLCLSIVKQLHIEVQ